MKKIILIATLLFTTTIVKAEEQAEQQSDVCSEVVFYNPNTQDIVEAAQVFNLQVIFSTCALRKHIKATENIYLKVKGFENTKKGYKVSYTVSDFTKYPKITERDCTTSSKFIHPEGGMWDAIQEVFSTPVCGSEIIVQDIDPKTGKITEYPR